MPAFTVGETDNELYRTTIENMTNEELVKEYKELLKARRRGYDRQYNLQLCFDVIRAAAEQRKFDIHKAIIDGTPKKAVVQAQIGDITMIPTPESSNIDCFGYDKIEKILYVKFKSGETVYPYKNVPINVFEDMKVAKSKGSFYHKNIRDKFK